MISLRRVFAWHRSLCLTVLLRKAWLKKTKYELFWAFLNFAFAFILAWDMKMGSSERFNSIYFLPTIVFWFEGFLSVAATFNGLFHLYVHRWKETATPFILPHSWRRLLNLPTDGEAHRHWLWSDREMRGAYPFLDPTFRFFTWTYWQRILRLWRDPTQLTPPRYSDANRFSWNINRTPRIRTKRSLVVEQSRQKMDDNILQGYMRRQVDDEEATEIMEVPATTEPWNDQDFLESFRRHPYECCSNIPSPLSDDPPTGCSENILRNFKVTDENITLWCERLRKWICETILERLLEGIDTVNKRLCELGLTGQQLGVASLTSLQQLCMVKPDLVILGTILPYLEVALNQEYLVQRLRELAEGGYLQEYKWNGGGKSWSKELPTDCAIIFHLFTTYLDALLPCDLHSVKNKGFSNYYVKKVPQKPVFGKGLHYLYKSKDDPAHFTVIIDDEVYGLSKGSNNLFAAFSFFFYYLNVKEKQALGRVNLGPSGLNISRIFDY